jgi:hypothetical protein
VRFEQPAAALAGQQQVGEARRPGAGEPQCDPVQPQEIAVAGIVERSRENLALDLQRCQRQPRQAPAADPEPAGKRQVGRRQRPPASTSETGVARE